LAIRSVASNAALLANTLGITNKASQNSLIAIYSLDSTVLAKSSKCIDNATSHAPPPGTT